MTSARGKLLTRVVLFATAVVLVGFGKHMPSSLFDLLEWMWLVAALPAMVLPIPTGVKAVVLVIAAVGATYLVLAVVVIAGRALLLGVREAVRLRARGSGGTPPA